MRRRCLQCWDNLGYFSSKIDSNAMNAIKDYELRHVPTCQLGP